MKSLLFLKGEQRLFEAQEDGAMTDDLQYQFRMNACKQQGEVIHPAVCVC